MNVKNLITSVGVSALLLGIGMNTHRAWNDHGIKEASLSQFVAGQGTSSSTSIQCTKRGGTEKKKLVLMREVCLKEVSGNISLSVAASLLNLVKSGVIPEGIAGIGLEGRIVFGNQCTCQNPGSDYGGVRGCDYTWETFCQ